MEQIIIDLKGKEDLIEGIGTKLFDRIVGLPSTVRPIDEKPRTGIQIYMRQPGTRNSAFVSVYCPSKDAMTFSVEKSVRTEMLGHCSSQNSADPSLMRFSGCIVMELDGIKYHCSVSGLKDFEDVTTAVVVMLEVLMVNKIGVLTYVKFHGGMLPKEFDSCAYVKEILDEYFGLILLFPLKIPAVSAGFSIIENLCGKYYLSKDLSISFFSILMKNGLPCWQTNSQGIISNHWLTRCCISCRESLSPALTDVLQALDANILSNIISKLISSRYNMMLNNFSRSILYIENICGMA